jgi:hypothetical protein
MIWLEHALAQYKTSPLPSLSNAFIYCFLSMAATLLECTCSNLDSRKRVKILEPFRTTSFYTACHSNGTMEPPQNSFSTVLALMLLQLESLEKLLPHAATSHKEQT